jgi:hypothetical protein
MIGIFAAILLRKKYIPIICPPIDMSSVKTLLHSRIRLVFFRHLLPIPCGWYILAISQRRLKSEWWRKALFGIIPCGIVVIRNCPIEIAAHDIPLVMFVLNISKPCLWNVGQRLYEKNVLVLSHFHYCIKIPSPICFRLLQTCGGYCFCPMSLRATRNFQRSLWHAFRSTHSCDVRRIVELYNRLMNSGTFEPPMSE